MPPPEPSGLGARRLAVTLIEAVLRSRRSLEEALEDASREPWLVALEARDRGFGRLIAATVLRRWGSLSRVLAQFMEKPLPASASRANAILLSGAAQILLIGTPAHAAINLAVEQASRDPAARRFAKLTNAVLRRVAGDGAARLAVIDPVEADFPEWMISRWRAAYGADVAAAIAHGSLVEAPLDLSLKDRDRGAEWASALDGILLASGSIRLAEHGRVEDLPGFADGAWWVQDAAAALPSRLLGDVAGLAIADLAAAPGGKTASLAAAGGHVTAVDASAKRLERLQANMARLGLGDRVVVVAERVAAWRPERLFDAVLLDAPCTATGTIRRHPDILHVKRPQDPLRLASLQGALLADAARLVRPGGRIVYCVCSLELEEGPHVVARFLAEHTDFVRSPVTVADFGGVTQAAAWITADGDLRTLPSHDPRRSAAPAFSPPGDQAAPVGSGMDGFYAARLVRRGP